MKRVNMDVLNVLVVVLVICCLFFERLIPDNIFNAIHSTFWVYVSLLFVVGSVGTIFYARISKLTVFLLLLILIAIISALVNGVDLIQAIIVFSFTAKYYVFYYVVNQFNTLNKQRLEVLIISILSAEALLGIAQYLMPEYYHTMLLTTLADSTKDFIDRMSVTGVSGTFGSKNVYALIMNIGLIMTIKTYMAHRNMFYRILIMLFLTAILISASRLNILLIMLFGAYLLLKRYGWGLAAVGASMVVVPFLVLLLETDVAYNSQKGELMALFGSEYWQVALEHSRLLSWVIGLEIIGENPFLGVGAGNWGAGLTYSTDQYYASYREYTIIANVLQDNYWISEATQFGLVYLTVLMSLYVYIWMSLPDNYYNNYFMVVILVTSIIYPTVIMKSVGLLFWIYLALNGSNRSKRDVLPELRSSPQPSPATKTITGAGT